MNKSVIVHFKPDLGQDDLVVDGSDAGYAVPESSSVARVWSDPKHTYIIPLANIISIEFKY